MRTIPASTLTALVLTYNEELNIERVLNQLRWVEKVIILDSYSTDATMSIAEKFPNTQIHLRKFDTFASQCNYGLSCIDSPWVLSLDSDYVLPDEFIRETMEYIKYSVPVAYYTPFKFMVFGKPLLRDNTTSRPVLFQKEHCHYFDDGHAHRLSVNGSSGSYKSFIYHDDRKPLSHWIAMLDKYSIKECEKILHPKAASARGFVRRIRRTKVLAPFGVFFYCFFVNGFFLNGWRGWHYTLQRTLVEILFAIRLIEEEKLKPDTSPDIERGNIAGESATKKNPYVVAEQYHGKEK